MKRYLLLFVSVFSLSSFSESKAHTIFPNGSYLGEGRYFTSTGQKGNYSSYADVYNDECDAVYINDGKLSRYNAIFDFTNGGFFSVNVIQFSDDGIASWHDGDGYCIDDSCHMNVILKHGTIEETLTFITKENRVERLGSLHYIDDQGLEQTIAWQENMMLIDFPFDLE